MPSHDSFQQIVWRVWRARESCEAMDVLSKDFVHSKFYSTSFNQDRNGRLVLRCRDVKPMPPNFFFLLGEAAHNLRSALDHLIFAFCKPAKGKENTVQFPICSSRKNFKTQKWRMPGAPPGILKLVESVQPYHRRKRPEVEFLGQLQAINNWDKHRSLTAAAASIDQTMLQIKIIGNTSIVRHETFRGRIEDGKVIARILPGHSEVGAEIHANPILGLFPVFDNGMPKGIRGKGVRAIINGAGHFIENEILPEFKKFF